MLFDQPVPARVLITLGDAMIKLAGVRPPTKQYPHGIERFPKSASGLSQVRGPFGVNLKPEAKGARGWFEGVPHDIETQIEWLSEQPLNRAEDAVREAQKHKPPEKPIRRAPDYAHLLNNADASPHFNILNYVDYRRAGGSFVAQCPVCANEGHDRHSDNLHITDDGSIFCCWFGGQPGKIHRRRDIIVCVLLQREAI